jgi:hypothetical protein
MLARLALQILSIFWGLKHEYIAEVRKFLKGTEWDSEEDVRQVAIQVAGEILRTSDDHELLSLLCELVERKEENPYLSQDAYRALGRAAGLEWNEVPAASRTFEVPADDEMIQAAHTRLRSHGGG